MVEIAPFRGLRYNPEKVGSLADVVIPPYDVISPTEQELFHQISPYNMVHLELGKTTPWILPTTILISAPLKRFGSGNPPIS